MQEHFLRLGVFFNSGLQSGRTSVKLLEAIQVAGAAEKKDLAPTCGLCGSTEGKLVLDE